MLCHERFKVGEFAGRMCVRPECFIGMDTEADLDKCVDFSLELIELGFEEGLEL